MFALQNDYEATVHRNRSAVTDSRCIRGGLPAKPSRDVPLNPQLALRTVAHRSRWQFPGSLTGRGRVPDKAVTPIKLRVQKIGGTCKSVKVYKLKTQQLAEIVFGNVVAVEIML